METELSKKSPMIFAGNKYYDLVIEIMQDIQKLMFHGDYNSAVVQLVVLHSYVSPFIDDAANEKIKTELYSILETSESWSHVSSRGTPMRDINMSTRKRILDAQYQMYKECKELFLKTSAGEREVTAEDAIRRMFK
jgi:hypothetical protein